MDLGVEEQAAKDWMAVRKAKRAPLTETVIKSLKAEASKAGMTVDDAVKMCAERSWQGFKASWIANQKGNGTTLVEICQFVDRKGAEICGNLNAKASKNYGGKPVCAHHEGELARAASTPMPVDILAMVHSRREVDT